MKFVDPSLNYLIPFKFDDLGRIGGKFDGGYVVPKRPFDETDVLISFGMGDSFDLEDNYSNSNGIVHVYDHTVNLNIFILRFLKQVKRLLYFKSNFDSIKNRFRTIKKYYLANKNKNFVHFKKKISNSINLKEDILVEDVFKKISSNNIFLSIDIEGDEYKILKEVTYYSERVNLLIVEFHDIENNLNIFQENVKTILEDFIIVHLHGNNCSYISKYGLPNVLEITFVNKKKYKTLQNRSKVLKFPINDLDQPNHPYIKDLNFQFSVWLVKNYKLI